MAHYVLHREIYALFSGDSLDEWVEFYHKHNRAIDRAERQADIFAGFLLMPLSDLQSDLKKLNEKYKSCEKDLKRDRLEYEISRKYKVSLRTAQIQMKNLEYKF